MMGLYANKRLNGLTSARESISQVFYIYVEPSDAGKIYRMGDVKPIHQTSLNNDVLPIYKYLSEIINVWKYLFDKYW